MASAAVTTSPGDPPPAQPYAPPRAVESPVPAPAGDLVLAERLTRLGAAVIDTVIAVGPTLVAGSVAAGWLVPQIFAQERARAAGGSNPEPDQDTLGVLALIVLVTLIWMLGISIYQWVRIATTGQSIGKSRLGIKIVRTDGTPVNFGSGVAVRSIVPLLIAGIPYAGALFWLVSLLFIFREDRQCLHDLMATTKVVVAPPRPPAV
jgi:uncharacterized RDD family membrane protein YckC